jgi:hypothetical protein
LFKKIILIMGLISLTPSLFAETTPNEFPPGEMPPTWDQPYSLSTQDRGVIPGMNPIPESQVPPTRGVIHVRRDNNIDPEREYPILGGRGGLALEIDPEREYPILGGRGILANEIDPERENPILGGRGVLANQIDPEREYPILGGRGVLNSEIDPSEDERPLPRPVLPFPWNVISQITIPGLGPAKEGGIDFTNNRNSEIDYDSGFPGQVALPKIDLVRDLTRSFTQNPDLRMHTVTLSVGAVAASTLILAYRTLGLGGRQRALAAIIPPQLIMDSLGREGYRVPAHSDYSTEDVRELALMMSQMSDAELELFLSEADPELIEYFVIVAEYIRQADALIFMQSCPNPDLCA